MSSSIGRTLRIVGIILIVILAIELLILSPKLFGRVTYPSDTSAEREVPNLASLPDQDTAPLSSSTPTILPTPTLVVMPTETATPTATQQKIEPTASLTITETAVTETPEPTVVPVVTETISITIAAPLEQTDSAEIPNAYSINSIIHKKQAGFWGYAGPDNLAILMSYWGVKTTQYDVAAVLFGSAERTVDYNVSPSELVSYVQENSDLNVVMRSGGTLELLRELVAAGFPVLIQNSFPVPGDRGWLGHYTIINGYNQTRDTFLTTDTFVGPFQNYDARHIEDSWRAFNNLFIVLYPDARADQAVGVLREWVDEKWALQRAMAYAGFDVAELTGRDQFFAQFNIGTSLVALGDYEQAAEAYDLAYGLQAELSDFDKPIRILWYQTGPYAAYFNSGSYQKVIDLADAALAILPEPVLEESLYWRGLAAAELNDSAQSEADLNLAHSLNPQLFPVEE